MNDARIDGLERTVSILMLRLAAAEAEVARLGQVMWQLGATAGGSSGGQGVQIATGGGVPAKAGTVLGSASYTLQTLDPSTGLLSAGPTATVWNNGTNAVSNPVVVAKDPSGNWIVITEFCP
jgi:hypothetical protein